MMPDAIVKLYSGGAVVLLSPSGKWYDIFINCNWVVTRWQ